MYLYSTVGLLLTHILLGTEDYNQNPMMHSFFLHSSNFLSTYYNPVLKNSKFVRVESIESSSSTPTNVWVCGIHLRGSIVIVRK